MSPIESSNPIQPISDTSWWFQPIWKICSSNWIISPIFGVNIWVTTTNRNTISPGLKPAAVLFTFFYPGTEATFPALFDGNVLVGLHILWFKLLQAHRIRGTGIFTHMNGGFFYGKFQVTIPVPWMGRIIELNVDLVESWRKTHARKNNCTVFWKTES